MTSRAPAQDYLVFDLGALPGRESSWGYGISNLNYVVGESGEIIPSSQQAFLWKPVAEPTWTGFESPGMLALAGDPSVAWKINDDSVLVGDLEPNAGSDKQGFMWQPTGVVPTWPTFAPNVLPSVPEGDGWTDAKALSFGSDPLYIVGSARVPEGPFDSDDFAFLWRSDVPDGPSVQMQGQSPYPEPHFHGLALAPHALLAGGGVDHHGACPPEGCPLIGLEWQLPGTSGLPLPALPGPGQVDSGQAQDVADNGLIVGQLEDAVPGEIHAVLWHWQADPFDLHDSAVPALPIDDHSTAHAIRNNALEIVGANTASSEALLWRWDAQTTSWRSIILNSTIRECGWLLRDARDVNERGWIVGYGLHGGDVRAFVLVPRDRPCPADISGPVGVPDGYVDVADLLSLLGAWGDCAACDQCAADTDDSGAVDVVDLLTVLASWSDVRFACDGNGDMPTSVEDCIQKFGYGDPVALEACIEAVTGGS